MTAITAPQVDVYRHERAGIVERMTCALHPHTRWHDEREATSGSQPRIDNTPWAHAVGAACAWLRKHPDSGEHPAAADVLWCVVMQDGCANEMLRAATALARVWRGHIPRVRRMAWGSPQLGEVEYAAGIVVIRCTSGVATRDKPRLDWQLWEGLQRHGERAVWEWADTASRRAAAALGG